MRVFFDTNVLVSALLASGVCHSLLHEIITDHELIISEPVISELRRVLIDRFHAEESIIAELEVLLRRAEVHPASTHASPVRVRDPADEVILASAIAANADVMVTGDRDLLDVAARSPIRIVSPREFLLLFGRKH